MTARILIDNWRDAILSLDAECGQMILTSPPYFGLRSYLPSTHPLKSFELGQESTPEEYIAKLVDGLRDAKRLLPKNGVLWVNIGDSYSTSGTRQGNANGAMRDRSRQEASRTGYRGTVAGYKNKDLIGVPWMLAFALRADGWYWRSRITWAKPNGTPESVVDRPTISSEIVLLLSKSEKYYYDAKAVRRPLQPSSESRFMQPRFDEQAGSTRANGNTRADRPMKPVRFGGTKYAGNDREEGSENAGHLGQLRDEQRDLLRADDRVGANGGGLLSRRERAERGAGRQAGRGTHAGRTYSGNEWRPSGSGL